MPTKITVSGDQVTETDQIGPPVGPQTTVSTKSPLTRELTSTGTWPWISAERYLRALPNPIDLLTEDFGLALYDVEMLRDPQIFSTLRILVMAVLAQDVQFEAAVDGETVDQNHPEYKTAKAVADFCEACIERMDRPFLQVLDELVEGALKLGHKGAEEVWEHAHVEPRPGPSLVPRDFKVKPNEAWCFVVDDKNNVLWLQPLLPTGQYPDLADEETRIARSKFFIVANRPRNADPRGSSHLESVYTPWWKKQQITPEHLAFLARFAEPSLAQELHEGAQDIPVYADDGVTVIDHRSIIDASNEALLGLRGGGVTTHQHGGRIYPIEASGEASLFLNAYDHEDAQMAKGILMQTLTTEQAAHMARAASQTHQDVFGILIQFVREFAEDAGEKDVARKIVLYNYGEDKLRFTPHLNLGRIEGVDWPDTARAVASLDQVGYVGHSQRTGLDQKLGLPPRDEAADEKWAAEHAPVPAPIPQGQSGTPSSHPSPQDGPKRGQNPQNPQQPTTGVPGPKPGRAPTAPQKPGSRS